MYNNTFDEKYLYLKKIINFASTNLNLSLSSKDIEKELLRSIYKNINNQDFKKTVILNSRSLIEKDYNFTYFAGRILLSYIYEEVLSWNIMTDSLNKLNKLHKIYFEKYIQYAVKIGRLSKKLLSYNLTKLSSVIDYKYDFNFEYIGIQTLYDRYLIIDKTQKQYKRLEVPQFFWMRVAMGIFTNEKLDKEKWVIKLYSLYKNKYFCSSTPTLFNSGTKRSQLSSCYLFKVDDSIESIMIRGIAENAYLSKWAGGLGGSWTSVRGTGSYIQGTNGESQGVIPFLRLFNDLLVAVNQGGKRKGAGCAYLETWHNDIEDFLELRRNTGDERRRTHDMHTANWIPDLFMKRVEKRENWTLFRSNETPDLHDLYGKSFEKKYIEYEKQAQEGKIFGKTQPAINIWKKMLHMLFETGHPWITFKDACNIRNPQSHMGIIHSSNLCTEITLNTNKNETAVCNLGSIVLDTHINPETKKINISQLEETIQIAIRALDNVINNNFYPTQASYKSNMQHRPIGLGVMGLQNALYIKNISFNSDEAIEFNDEFMEIIAFYAYKASSDLAAERGCYPSYKGSKWDQGILPQDTIKILENERDIKIKVPLTSKMNWDIVRDNIAKHGMRNSNVIAIAPTATIANIMGTTPCIEPSYKNLFVKSNLSGEFIYLNKFLVEDLKQNNLWNPYIIDQLKYFDGTLSKIKEIPNNIKLKYLTAFEIDYKAIIYAAARRQKWIDQSQSLNLFLLKPELKTISHMYRLAWHCGLKTTYYLRTKSASNIEKSTVSLKNNKINKNLLFYEQKNINLKKTCTVINNKNDYDTCETCQ